MKRMFATLALLASGATGASAQQGIGVPPGGAFDLSCPSKNGLYMDMARSSWGNASSVVAFDVFSKTMPDPDCCPLFDEKGQPSVSGKPKPDCPMRVWTLLPRQPG